MKNIFFSLLCLAGFLTLTSCSKDDSSDDNTVTNIQNTVKAGTWHITSFVDSGDDETHHFQGYSFTFSDNNMLTATDGTQTYTGSWSIDDSNSNDDSIDDLHFNINFNLSNEFEELNEDWNILSRTSNRIELIHISGGNGGTDHLIFEKG